jgi:asparaginyl-tRNA synthetase
MDTPIFTLRPAKARQPCSKLITSTTNKAYLTQSGQLYNEATAAAFGKVIASARHFAQRSQRRGDI